MKKLLYTTTAFVLCGGIVQANAACIATPSCTAMGYTSTSSCTNGIKCPFGEYWNCANSDLSNKITELENKINSGAGAGTDPSDKTYDCKIGDIFYSDWTCSTELDANKTPIAVVVYMDGAGHGQALALNSIGRYYWQTCSWNEDSLNYTCKDVEAVPNYTSNDDASKDLNSCINTRLLVASGTSNDFPAAWAVSYYKTAGTKAGDWCLPAAGIFTSYYNNKDAVNAGFDKVGGVKFSSGWSSTEEDGWDAWRGYLSQPSGIYIDYGYDGKRNTYQVYPVLEF